MRVLVPFCAGTYSLYLLFQVLKREVPVLLLYIPNLFPHNGSLREQDAVKTFVKNLRAHGGELLATFDKDAKKYRDDLISFQVPVNAHKHIESKFMYLAGLCVQLAQIYKCSEIAWHKSRAHLSDSQFMDIQELLRGTGVSLWFPPEVEPLPWLLEFQESVEHEFREYRDKDQEPMPLGLYWEDPESFRPLLHLVSCESPKEHQDRDRFAKCDCAKCRALCRFLTEHDLLDPEDQLEKTQEPPHKEKPQRNKRARKRLKTQF